MVFIAYLSRNNKTFFYNRAGRFFAAACPGAARIERTIVRQTIVRLVFQVEKRADVSMRRKLKRTIVQSEVRKLSPSQGDELIGKRKTEQ